MPSDVAIVTDPAADPRQLLDRAAAALAFDDHVREALQSCGEGQGNGRGGGQIVIVPAMAGFSANSPAMTNPKLVEHLIDRLYDLGADSVIVGTTEASDALWAENRDVFMRADLLGYDYVTSAGRDYDIVDLAEDAAESPFPADSALAGIALSTLWQQAACRILFAANMTDSADGYALTLDTLLSVLPGRDKDCLYMRQRDPGAVTRALLAAAPVDFAFIDAAVSSHGEGGGIRPLPIATSTIIAARDPVLADRAGALKMGLDPQVSRLWAGAASMADAGCRTIGNLAPYDGWINVPPLSRDAARRRQKDAALDRSVRPLLQQLDTSLFPFRNEVNGRLNEILARLLPANSSQTARSLTLINILLAQLAEARTGWQAIGQKDALVRSTARLNVDPDSIEESEWGKVAPALTRQRQLLDGCHADEQGLRWRMVGGAVLFDCVRRFPVPFEDFIASVPIHRTIQYMNDYIGGEAVSVAGNTEGQVTRQLERNLYLPQPNFTALLGGQVIDVTKIETLHYRDGHQSMAWQTLFSENGSALADDGLVTFSGVGNDTVVSIFARQHFRQPPLIEAFDLTLFPALHAALVTDAYHRFASRTFANLEAVLEGRDVRIGRPSALIDEDEPLPVDRLLAFAERLRDELPEDWADRLRAGFTFAQGKDPAPDLIDADGLRHFSSTRSANPDLSAKPPILTGLFADFSRALDVDAGARP